MKRTMMAALSIAMLAGFLGGCFVWNSIKDRYQPYKLTDEVKDGKKKVIFVFDSPSSKTVALAGQFNNWTPPGASVSANETKNIILWMERNKESGFWERELWMDPGKYQYKYVLDGATWREDPNTLEKVPDGYGGNNSIVVVP